MSSFPRGGHAARKAQWISLRGRDRLAPCPVPRTRQPTRWRSGSIRPAPRGGRRERCIRTPTCIGPQSFTASRVLGLRESDVVFSAAKLFFAYGLGNALTFPPRVGATTILDGRNGRRRPPCLRASGNISRRSSTACRRSTRRCSPRPELPRAAKSPCARCVSAGEALPPRSGRALRRAFRLRSPGRHRLDRDAAHLPVESAR